MATRKANNTRKANSTRKGVTKERKVVENRYPDNKIIDFGIENVRYFEDNFGCDSAYFNLDLGFMIVMGMLYRQNKDGVGYVTFPSEKGRDGNYYKCGYINDECLASAIRDAVEDAMND